VTYDEQKTAIQDAAALFPPTFGLRGFPGETFRISVRSSYWSEDVMYLYTDVLKGDKWLSFCKGTVSELRAEVRS
jgi:hypothetical protein